MEYAKRRKRSLISVLHKPPISWYALNIKYIGGLNMKLDDVVEVNFVDRSPKETISTGQGNGCENYYGRC